MDLSGDDVTIINLIFASGLMTLHASLIWIVSLIIILIFFSLGYFIFNVAHKKALEDLNLSRFLLLIGLFLIYIYLRLINEWSY